MSRQCIDAQLREYCSRSDYATVKYDADGNLWVASYSGPANSYDEATAIALDGAGIVYVTGTSDRAFETNPDYATVKYTQN